MNPPPQSWPWWRWLLTGLSAIALTLSAYLSWHYLVGGSVIGCGGGSPCDQILSGRWSTIAGVVPVSGLAAGAYLAMLIASLSIGPATPAPVRQLAWRAMLVIVGAAAGSAIWFTILQKWVIGSFCPYCMTTHIIGLLLATLVLWRAPKETNDESNKPKLSPAQQRLIGRLRAIGLAFAGLTIAAIMATCQVGLKPPAVYSGGETQKNLPTLDSQAVPLVGSPNAPYIVSLLFDYKCPHCQQLHFLLDEVVRRYNGKLAFALCPTPLNPQCNSYVPREVDEFKDSCELAKTGLAVWLANREAYPAFELWMFTLESGDKWEPRALDAARAKAIELVGKENFEAARANPWIDQYIQTSVRLYGDTGGKAIPKLVFGSRWVTPKAYDADELITILENTLSVPTPTPKG